MRVTPRGWAVITMLAVVAGIIAGTVMTTGDNPCEYAVTTVECP